MGTFAQGKHHRQDTSPRVAGSAAVVLARQRHKEPTDGCRHVHRQQQGRGGLDVFRVLFGVVPGE